jgi:hypothetical protein
VSGEASNYHINLEPAHTTLAQACLGVLLRMHYDIDRHTPSDHPLAQYTAEHWTTHTQIEDVSSQLQKGMEYLFDPNKPHFGVWRSLHDIDTPPFSSIFFDSENAQRSASAPIYYAALYGFHDLVEHLIIKYLQDVNASGGYFVRPLVAALAKKHFQTAELLHHNSADLHCQGNAMMSPLHLKAENGDVKVAQKLIKYGVDINAEDLHGCTPLHVASLCSNHKDGSVH